MIASIRAYGIHTPLLITKENVVISGHRRLDAARQIGVASVPVIVFESTDDLAIRRALVENNRNRVKENEQKAREAAELLAIEAEAAKRRQKELAGTRPNSEPAPVLVAPERVKDNVQRGREATVLFEVEEETAQRRRVMPPQTANTDLGKLLSQGRAPKSAERVGEAVGWSAPTVNKAVEVVKAIDTLAVSGCKWLASAGKGGVPQWRWESITMGLLRAVVQEHHGSVSPNGHPPNGYLAALVAAPAQTLPALGGSGGTSPSGRRRIMWRR